MGLREQSIVGCFPEFVFQFSIAQVLVGLRKQVKVKSSMARSLPVENLLPQNVGSIINYLQ